MEMQNLRVVVASESPRVRSFLSQIVEHERGVDIVGQAPNAQKVLTLSRDLRPNVVILDSYLPYSTSMETVPISRNSGLDVAQVISEEIPRTKVILVNNLDSRALAGGSLATVTDGEFGDYCVAVGGKCISINEWPEVVGSGESELVFASIEARGGEVPQKTTNVLDKLVFFGALGFAGGFALTLTIILAPAGVVMAGLGTLSAIVGLVGKLGVSLWRKMKNTEAKRLAR